jgi:hypothetical protein
MPRVAQATLIHLLRLEGSANSETPSLTAIMHAARMSELANEGLPGVRRYETHHHRSIIRYRIIFHQNEYLYRRSILRETMPHSSRFLARRMHTVMTAAGTFKINFEFGKKLREL